MCICIFPSENDFKLGANFKSFVDVFVLNFPSTIYIYMM